MPEISITVPETMETSSTTTTTEAASSTQQETTTTTSTEEPGSEEWRNHPINDQESTTPKPFQCKYINWKIMGAILAFLVVLGWVFIVVMLILEEKWQLVLVAWLLLYSAAHFCYWYCKRHSLLTFNRRIRLRVLTQDAENGEKTVDGPPTYDEVMNTEAPPPAYFTVVSEESKTSSAISPCVPAGIPSASFSCSNEKQLQKDNNEEKKAKKSKRSNRPQLTLEILECPPAYQSPRSPRALSPRIPSSTNNPGLSLVTATAAASAAATATAAFSYLAPPSIEQTEVLEDPLRSPIVQHLRSAEMPTLEVSSNIDVSNGIEDDVTSNVLNENQISVIDVSRSSIL